MRTLALPLVVALLACVSGCADDRGDRHHQEDDGSGTCTLLGCSSAVAIHLGAVLSPLPKSAPLEIHACVGSECVDVEYSPASAAGATCTPSRGGATSGPTVACVLTPGGDVSLQISLDADPGTAPVVAVAVASGGALLVSHAETATLTARTPNGAQCGPVCSQGEITFSHP